MMLSQPGAVSRAELMGVMRRVERVLDTYKKREQVYLKRIEELEKRPALK